MQCFNALLSFYYKIFYCKISAIMSMTVFPIQTFINSNRHGSTTPPYVARKVTFRATKISRYVIVVSTSRFAERWLKK